MNKRKKFMGQYIIIFMFIGVVFISATLGIGKQILNIKKYNEEIADLKSQIENTDKSINKLKQDKKNINEDEYIEKIARERLHMVKPNELIYIDINKKE